MKLIILLIGLIAVPVSSSPVFLECTAVGTGGHERHLQIGLNENEGTAQITIVETGFADSGPAMFTPNEVTWARPVAGFRQHMTVNRSTLAFSSHMDGIGDADEHGQCVIPKANADRKF